VKESINHGVNFGLLSTAAFIAASPKPYVFQSKEEFIAQYQSNVEAKQPLNLVVRNYSNDLLTMGLGCAAIYSLVRLVMSLDAKPMIKQQIQPQPVAINNVFSPMVKNVAVAQRSPQSQSQPKPFRTVEDSELMDDTGAWILSMMMADNSLKRQHYKIDGVTQSGKTTFAEHLLTILSRENELAEKLLIDPKYRKGKPNWSFNPYCSDIEKVLKALDDFAKEITLRQQSDEDFGSMPPIIFIIDEWDWIYTEHGKSAVTKLRKLIKVGAELGCYCVVLGQSPLSGDTGLSTSDFDQLVRISIGKSAIKVLNNPSQFPFNNRAELLLKAEALYSSGQRFALVQEHGVAPRLELVPNIQKPNQTDTEQVINNVIPIRRAS
jgi:hypothetical protein